MIDELLRQAVQDRRLAGLTIWRTSDGRYQASLSPDRVSWSVETDPDIVTALRRVLGERDQSTGAFE